MIMTSKTGPFLTILALVLAAIPAVLADDATTNAPAASPTLAPTPAPALTDPTANASAAAPAAPAPTAATTPITPPVHSGPFVHPGIFYSADDLAFARKKIQDKADPWNSAYEASFKNNNDTRATNATAAWDATKDGYMHGDPMTAHAEALQWALTGDPAHAANAIKILNAWSSTLTSVVTHSMPQEKLAIGWDGLHFVNAAELLCYANPDGKQSGWSDADVQQFKKMLGLFYPVIQNFYSNFNGNWDASMMATMISMAVFLDDNDMFNHVIEHYVVGEKLNGGILYYVAPSGQCQEAGRDQGHCCMGLGNLVATCEVAKRQGIDLYGVYNNRLMTALEVYAKYNLGNDDVPFDPTFGGYKQISPGGRGIFAGMWEAPYQHYVYDKGLEMPYAKQVVFGTNIIVNGRNHNQPGVYRPEGGSLNTGIGYGTLMQFKGDQK
jgi:hypothetical protein